MQAPYKLMDTTKDKRRTRFNGERVKSLLSALPAINLNSTYGIKELDRNENLKEESMDYLDIFCRKRSNVDLMSQTNLSVATKAYAPSISPSHLQALGSEGK